MENQNKIFRLLLGVALIAGLCFFLPDWGDKEKAITVDDRIPLLAGITIVNNGDKTLYIGLVGEKDTNKMRRLNRGEGYALGKTEFNILYLQGKK